MQTDQKITAMLGSDVRFKVQILGSDQAHSVSISSVSAYFINRDLRQQMEQYGSAEDVKKAQFKFLRRYPIEFYVNDCRSTCCCLNNPGCYGYNHMPVGTCLPVYNGFGTEPYLRKPVDIIQDESVVRAITYYCSDRSSVEIYLPGDRQKHIGDYDLVITAKIHNDSYKVDHVRTFTVSYESILELTENSEDIPSGIYDIVITDTSGSTLANDDIYVNRGLLNSDTINLYRSDDAVVNIDVSSITDQLDWYEHPLGY